MKEVGRSPGATDRETHFVIEQANPSVWVFVASICRLLRPVAASHLVPRRV